MKLEYVSIKVLSTLITKYINIQKYLNHTRLISKWYGLFWTDNLPADIEPLLEMPARPRNSLLVGMIIEDLSVKGFQSAKTFFRKN